MNQPNKKVHTGALLICYFISGNCFQLMSDWKLENLPNGKEISIAQSEQKKRTTSISKWNFPEKSLIHLTFNQNFWIFSAKW